MNRPRLQKSGTYALFTLALLTLSLIGWGAWQQGSFPYDGLSWSLLTGRVGAVNTPGPAVGLLQAGDQILTIEGRAILQALPLYSGKEAGDPVTYLIERQGVRQEIILRLASSSLSERLFRILPLLIALIFWGIGVYVLVFQPRGDKSLLFFLLCQVVSVALVSGSLSNSGPLWMSRLFGVLLWWAVPLSIHFHLIFPVSPSIRHSRPLRALLYALAALGSLPHLVWDPVTLYASAGFPALYIVRRLWLAAGLFGVLLLLVQAYRRAASSEARRQVGLVTLGGALALMPFISLSLLPDALLRQPLLPYEVSFLFLLAIPLAYGYAILRYRLIRLDRYANRSAAHVLVFTLLAGLYVTLRAASNRLLPPHLVAHPLTDTLIVLLLAASFGPLHRRLRIIVSHLFYGGWYDYRSAVGQISRALDQVTDSPALAQTLCQEMQTAMQLACVCLLLPNRTGALTTAGLACQSCPVHPPGKLHLQADGPLCQQLLGQPHPLATESLRSLLAGRPLSDAEQRLLACTRARLWLPLFTSDHLIGLFILGPRRGGEAFDANDRDILQVVARQAGIAVHNALLFAELQRGAQERERLHQRVLHAREEERKHVARELHDRIIQALIGLKYNLSSMMNSPVSEVEERAARLEGEIRQMLGDVRQICTDLRPPTLDTLGLVAAVRSHLGDVEAQNSHQFTLAVEGDAEQEIPEEAALCLYRVLQEALLNVEKHAAARRVYVGLQISPDEVILSVEDNGRGFIVPQRLGQFTNDGRFGLMGAGERLQLAGGTLVVASAPRRGTRLEARVPLGL